MTRLDGFRHVRLAAIVCAVFAIVSVPGCGPGESDGPSMTGDPAAISDLIDDFNEMGPHPSLFAEGKAPAGAERTGYQTYSFALAGKPRVSGSPATVPILVFNETVGKEAGTVDWTFVKVGEQWKVESAPLP